MEYQKVDIANTSVTAIPVNVMNLNRATDVYIQAGSLNAGATIVIRPALGEKIAVQVFSESNGGQIQVEYTTDGVSYYRGSYGCFGASGVFGSGGVNTIAGNSPTFYADNASYFRLRNGSGGALHYQVIGVKWI